MRSRPTDSSQYRVPADLVRRATAVATGAQLAAISTESAPTSVEPSGAHAAAAAARVACQSVTAAFQSVAPRVA